VGRDERHRANPKSWASRDELAALLGVETRAVDSWRVSLGNAAEEKQDNRVRLFLPEWLRLWAAYTQSGRAEADPADDGGVESEWLEEKRKWSARREQLKYQQEVGELIPEADVRRGYGLVANCMRKAAELFCGTCKDLLESSLDDAELQLDAAFDDSHSTESQPGELSPAGNAGAD